METYKCILCDRIITKTNESNHESTEFHKNNSLNKDNPSFTACICCEKVKNRNNFYDFHIICKDCNKKFRRQNVECQICDTITTRNYYHKHMKKHSVLIPIIGKICSKCNIDKHKQDGRKSICKELSEHSRTSGSKNNPLAHKVYHI
jgi:hypothetical protein